MRVYIVILICLLFSSCDRKSSRFNNLQNTVWIDSLCNEFHFKDSTFLKKRLFHKESNLDEVGKFKLENKIELEFNDEQNEVGKYHLEHEFNKRIVFISLNKHKNPIILFKRHLIKKTTLEILELELTAYPTFISSSGLQYLHITKDKKIQYRRVNNYVLEKSILSDSTFKQLTKYLEILQFDKYKNKYDFAGFDGTNYELKLKTNLYIKDIICTQRPTEGLHNLISFIDYKLQTEGNITKDCDNFTSLETYN